MKSIRKGLCAFLLLLGGCVAPVEKPKETARPLENIHVEYPDVPETNVFEVADKERFEKMFTHGTGVIYLGFPECPWCLAYAPMLNEAAEKAETSVLYYNIYKDKTNDPEFYAKIADAINTQDDTILSYDNDGNLRIYMPLVLFVENGTIVAYDNETCRISTKEISVADYWTEEKKNALLEKLEDLCIQNKNKQAENESGGCDDSCSGAPKPAQ